MNRRGFLKKLGVGALAAASSRAFPSLAFSRPSPERTGLNVLFIAADDLRVEIGSFGETTAKTPNLDKLAKRGMRFTRAYCQQALCNPSRASLLTGLRPDTLRISDLHTHFRQTRPDVVTLPQLFKNHGYHAQNIGKIFHNWRQDDYKGDALSWSVPEEMHYATHYSDVPMVEGEAPPSLAKVFKTECREVPDEAYFDGRIAAKAVAVLREIKNKPFFLGIGFWKPHLPFNAPKKYWDLYERAEIELPPNPESPKDVPEIALHNGRELLRDFKGRKPTDDEVRELRHGYYAATSFLDAQIGKVLDEIDSLDLYDNTIIVFWSDHGFHLGEHDLWCKTSNFELDARVPMIVAVPGQKTAGKASNSLVELIDLYPTLADLCDLPAPEDLEGISLRPVLDDPSAKVKTTALTQHPRPAYPSVGEDPDAMGYSVRTERYRYTEWRGFRDEKVTARELYDHETDPMETVNLATRPRYAKAVRNLAAQVNTQ